MLFMLPFQELFKHHPPPLFNPATAYYIALHYDYRLHKIRMQNANRT